MNKEYYKKFGYKYRRGDMVTAGMTGIHGRLVQVRLGAGACGSDMYLIRERGATLRRVENDSLSPDFSLPVSLRPSRDLDPDDAVYSVGSEKHSGFIVEAPDTEEEQVRDKQTVQKAVDKVDGEEMKFKRLVDEEAKRIKLEEMKACVACKYHTLSVTGAAVCIRDMRFFNDPVTGELEGEGAKRCTTQRSGKGILRKLLNLCGKEGVFFEPKPETYAARKELEELYERFAVALAGQSPEMDKDACSDDFGCEKDYCHCYDDCDCEQGECHCGDDCDCEQVEQ